MRIGQEYFGDGAMRQSTPLSPALRLGARRLLVIGVRNETPEPQPGPDEFVPYPNFAKIAGYILDSLFMDGLSSDLENLIRLNLILENVPGRVMQGSLGNSVTQTLSSSSPVRISVILPLDTSVRCPVPFGF